ncbi:MAG: rhodanese-like domain-containing protein [Desulfuromonadaceae bacterium]|nr:rhodanese-like domain-containing protein [Desulfuromonadaceae bacterium]
MSEKAIKKTKLMIFALLGVAIIATLVMWGCSNKSYDNPVAESTAAYYKNDAKAGISLVEASTVKDWVDAGGKTEDGKRIVILDCVPNASGVFSYSDTESWFAGDKAKVLQNLSDQYGGTTSAQYKSFNGMPESMFGHIPGAIPNVSHEGYEVAVRNDGPIDAEHEVGTGTLISQMLQKYGVTKDDVIVISTSRYDYPGFCPSRLWWTLYYWGFAKENIRVLNGGNKAYAMKGYPLQKGVTLPVVTPSSFDVAQLPQRHLESRISVGELIALVDSGRTSLPDSDPNQVVVLDTRQPPVAYYLADQNSDGIPDVFQLAEYTVASNKLFTRTSDAALLTLSEILFKETTPARVPFSGTTNPPITLPNPYVGITTPTGPSLTGGTPMAIPLGAKGAAFEGIVKGAKVTKAGAWNITVPALTRTTDGGYLTKAELLPILAKAGIDGTKPIVVYCNSGALASIYWYVFHEICEFKDVRMYDGSWQEWAMLAAYEPTDNTYIMTDDYTTFPSYPAASPSVVFFAGPNKYLEWNGTKFVDKYTGADASSHVKAGGPLGGIAKWDTITRSEHVMFRPTKTINDNALKGTANELKMLRTYSGAVDWPSITTYPNYSGTGNLIYEQDKAYTGVTATSGGSTPTAFIPKGGGC